MAAAADKTFRLSIREEWTQGRKDLLLRNVYDHYKDYGLSALARQAKLRDFCKMFNRREDAPSQYNERMDWILADNIEAAGNNKKDLSVVFSADCVIELSAFRINRTEDRISSIKFFIDTLCLCQGQTDLLRKDSLLMQNQHVFFRHGIMVFLTEDTLDHFSKQTLLRDAFVKAVIERVSREHLYGIIEAVEEKIAFAKQASALNEKWQFPQD